MQILANTAKMSASYPGATPGCFDDGKSLTFHLTKNYSNDKNTEKIANAILFNGSFNIVSSGPAELKQWEFGFTQYQDVETWSIYYAAPKASGGQIVFHFNKPTAMDDTLHLDSDIAFAPWTSAKGATVANGKVTATGGDHPASRAPRSFVNKLTKENNFLFHVVDKRTLWTVLSARSDKGEYTHLMHVKWELRYDMMFRWIGGNPAIHKTSSEFKVGDPVVGPPDGPAALKGLLKDPKAPLSNVTTREAIVRTFEGGFPNREDKSQRVFANLPPMFWG